MKGLYHNTTVFLPLKQLLPPAIRESSAKRYELYLLAESIRRFGLLCPVTVRRITGGYRLLDGAKRVQAAAIAGLSKVPCLVWQGEDELLYRAALHTADNRLNYETAGQAVQALLTCRSPEETACALGVTTAYLARLCVLNNLPVAVRRQLLTLCDPTAMALRLYALDEEDRQTALQELADWYRQEPPDDAADPTPDETTNALSGEASKKTAYHPTITDERFFENSAKQLVRRMNEGGLAASFRRRQTKQGKEWIIRLPLSPSPQMALPADA